MSDTKVPSWLGSVWLPLVVALTLGFGWLSFKLNPSIPAWCILAAGWLWMWLWWRLHHVVPGLAQSWYGPQMVVVVLSGVCLVWSLGLPLFRPDVLARSESPDGALRVVLTGRYGDTHYQLAREVYTGTLLDTLSDLSFEPDAHGWVEVPNAFAIRWFEDRQLVALEGDGRFVAVYDYDAKGLHERVSLRHAPDRIARLVGDDRRAPDGNGR